MYIVEWTKMYVQAVPEEAGGGLKRHSDSLEISEVRMYLCVAASNDGVPLGLCCTECSENEACVGGVLWGSVYCNGRGSLPCQLPPWQKQKLTASSKLVSCPWPCT